MGKFIVKHTNTGIKFDLIATNGQVIATSQVYTTKAACLNGIESVKTNAARANVEDQTVDPITQRPCPKFEIYVDKAGEYRFRLKATNGQIIAIGEGYKTINGCYNGVQSIMNNVHEALIEEKE